MSRPRAVCLCLWCPGSLMRGKILASALICWAAGGACHPGPDARSDVALTPTSLRLGPSTPHGKLEIHNRTDAAIELRTIRLDTDTRDWGSFALTDETLPSQVPAHASVTLHVRAFSRNFAKRDHQGPTGEFHHGSSAIVLEAGGHPMRSELQFAPRGGPYSGIIAATIGLLVLGLFALSLWPWAPTSARHGTQPGKSLRHRQNTGLLVACVWAFIAALLALPWAPGVCLPMFASLSAHDLAQCAAGRGGFAPGITSTAGLVLALAALAAAHRRASENDRSRDLYLLGFALACLAPAWSSGSLEFRSLMAHQADGWFVLEQPIACLVAILCAAGLLRSAPPHRGLWVAHTLAAGCCLGSVFFGGLSNPSATGELWVAIFFAGFAGFATATFVWRRIPARAVPSAVFACLAAVFCGLALGSEPTLPQPWWIGFEWTATAVGLAASIGLVCAAQSRLARFGEQAPARVLLGTAFVNLIATALWR